MLNVEPKSLACAPNLLTISLTHSSIILLKIDIFFIFIFSLIFFFSLGATHSGTQGSLLEPWQCSGTGEKYDSAACKKIP